MEKLLAGKEEAQPNAKEARSDGDKDSVASNIF